MRKEHKAAYARFVRTMRGPRGSAPPEVVEAFDGKGGVRTTKGGLFQLWKDKAGVWILGRHRFEVATMPSVAA